jgi:hypothetical protein
MAQHVAQNFAQQVAEQVAQLVAEHVAEHSSQDGTQHGVQVGVQHADGHRPRHASRLVVYTALLGGDRQLGEAPLAEESSADFVCFTDDRTLRSDTWQVIPVEPRLPTDALRSERYLKIVGHPALAGYDRTLWVDNAVELLELPETFVDHWLEEAEVAAPVHTSYRTVLEEAEAVVDLGRDDHLRVFEQLAHYVEASPSAVETNPHWTALLARRRTPEVAAAMTTWWEHVLRYSRREQLSFTVVMAASGLRLRSVPLPNLRSPLHRWPDGWATRAHDQAAESREPEGAGRHVADPALLRAEIEVVLDDGRDPHAWVWELEAQETAASARVSRLHDEVHRHRSS